MPRTLFHPVLAATNPAPKSARDRGMPNAFVAPIARPAHQDHRGYPRQIRQRHDETDFEIRNSPSPAQSGATTRCFRNWRRPRRSRPRPAAHPRIGDSRPRARSTAGASGISRFSISAFSSPESHGASWDCRGAIGAPQIRGGRPVIPRSRTAIASREGRRRRSSQDNPGKRPSDQGGERTAVMKMAVKRAR